MRVATVLSARPWESELVTAARETAAVKLVMRAYQPEDIFQSYGKLDVVVVGAETAWLGPALIADWRRQGLHVIGIYPAGDRPAAEMLDAGGCNEILADTVSPGEILSAVRLADFAVLGAGPSTGKLVVVTGPRGAPGRTEVAVALAWGFAENGRCLLADLDLEAPAIAIRLGVAPRPDLADAADGVRRLGVLTKDMLRQVGKLSVVVGSHRLGEPELKPQLAEETVEAGLGTYPVVVADLGPGLIQHARLIKRADVAVLVVEAAANGIVRAAKLLSEWSGPPPTLVLNRVTPAGRQEVIKSVRKWTGLEPAVLIPERAQIQHVARAARPPDRLLLRALRPVSA